MERARYDDIVAACALADDVACLPASDATELGERGINLSGDPSAVTETSELILGSANAQQICRQSHAPRLLAESSRA